MKKRVTTITLSAGALLLVGATARPVAAAEVPRSCYANLSDFLAEIEAGKKNMANQFLTGTSGDAGPVTQTIRQLRDKTRKMLMEVTDHDYPVIAMNDSPQADFWAKTAVGAVDSANKDAFKIDEIWTELDANLVTVKALQADIQRLTDDTVNNQILASAIEKRIAEGNIPASGFKIEFPKISRDANGAEKITMKEEYFGSDVAIKNRIQSLNGSIMFWKRAESRALRKLAHDRAIQQGVLVKKLETYRHWLVHQMTKNETAVLDPKFAAFKVELDNLYTDAGATRIKPEFSPPSWVWQRLKWRMLWAEVTTLTNKLTLVGDIFKGEDVEKVKRMIDYVHKLPDAEKRAMGLSNVTRKFEIAKRSRLARIGGVALAFPSGAAATIWKVRDYFWGDEIKKEQCAEANDEAAYLACADEYLRDRFPGRFLAKKEDLHTILDDFGEVADPEIRAELEDLRYRRVQYLIGKNLQDSITDPAKAQLLSDDPSSSTFRERLISTRNYTVFKEALMNTDPQKGYLAIRFGLAFSKPHVRELVSAVLDSEDPAAQLVILNSMKKMTIAKALAEDLQDLLDKRRDAIKTADEESRVAHELKIDLQKLTRSQSTRGLDVGPNGPTTTPEPAPVDPPTTRSSTSTTQPSK